MKRILAAALAAWLVFAGATPALAAVNVERTGSENPMVEVARSVFYGGLTGLMVGGAVAWASESNNSGDIVRWSFVGGTFLGLALGLQHVATRPQAMIEIKDGETRLGFAAPEVTPSGARLTLLRASY